MSKATARRGRRDAAAAAARGPPVGRGDPRRIQGDDGRDDRARRRSAPRDDARQPTRPARRAGQRAPRRDDPVFPRRRLRVRLPRDRPVADGTPRGQDRVQGVLAGLPARPRAPVPGRDRRRPERLPRTSRQRQGPLDHRVRRRLRRRRPHRHHLPRRPRRGPAHARRNRGVLPGTRRHPDGREHGHQGRHRPVLHPRGRGTHRGHVPRRSRTRTSPCSARPSSPT